MVRQRSAKPLFAGSNPAAAFIIISLCLVFLSLPSLKIGFWSDDYQWLRRGILSLKEPGEILRLNGRDFNPVTLFTYTATLSLFGKRSLPFHIENIILHISNAVLLFYLLLCFKVERKISLLSSLFWGINYRLSEVPLWITGRTYGLAMFFGLLGLISIVKNKRFIAYLFFILSLLSKEVGILFLLISLFYLPKKKEKTEAGIVFLILSAGRLLIQGKTTSPYLSFLSLSSIHKKLSFIFNNSLSLPSTALPMLVSLILLVMILIIPKGKRILSISAIIFLLPFVFLPKLSSRYYYIPSAFIISLAFLSMEKSKILPYVFFIPFSIFSLLMYQGEIKDYRELSLLWKSKIQGYSGFAQALPLEEPYGFCNFSYDREYLFLQKKILSTPGRVPKLMPIRKNGVGGIIKLEDLVPFLNYPERFIKTERVKGMPHRIFVFKEGFFIMKGYLKCPIYINHQL